MKTSTKGIDLIKRFEGLKLQSYLCPAKVWTIGFGTTKINGKPVTANMTISKDQAEQYLINDLIIFEIGVNSIFKTTTLNQNQFDALVSFAYNLGVTALLNSTLTKKIKVNTFDPTIKNEFLKWCYADGKILEGLQLRRKVEASLYFTTI